MVHPEILAMAWGLATALALVAAGCSQPNRAEEDYLKLSVRTVPDWTGETVVWESLDDDVKTPEATALLRKAVALGIASTSALQPEGLQPLADLVVERWEAGFARSSERLYKVMFSFEGNYLEVSKVIAVE